MKKLPLLLFHPITLVSTKAAGDCKQKPTRAHTCPRTRATAVAEKRSNLRAQIGQNLARRDFPCDSNKPNGDFGTGFLPRKTVNRPVLELLLITSSFGEVTGFPTVSFWDVSRRTPSGTRQSSLDHESCESGTENETLTEDLGRVNKEIVPATYSTDNAVLNVPSVDSVR